MSTSISIPTRPLSTKAGIEVSEICLGGATWRVESAGEPRMPASTPDASQAILNRYFDAGGNFIDVADVYQNGESERAVGQWLQRRQSGDATFRSRVVVATKYGLRVGPGPNQRGASRSHILRQVEQSLRRLQTDYIDLYVQHCWDRSTPIEETLHALNDLIRSGRVRYIGASNFSAWQLQKAATYAKAHGLTPFVSVQSQYNLLTRNLEWDVMDVCRAEGVAIMPWSPLAGGWLTGKYTKEGEEHSKDTNSRVGWAGTQSWAGAWSADTHCNDLTWTTVDALRRIAQKVNSPNTLITSPFPPPSPHAAHPRLTQHPLSFPPLSTLCRCPPLPSGGCCIGPA